MKKLIIAGAVTMFGLVSAQKNTLLVGGNVSLETMNDKSNGTTVSKGNSFELNPTIGYQFTDNWTAGVRFGIGTGKSTDYTVVGNNTYNTELKTNTFTYGVFGRYTLPLSEIFSAYGDLDVYAGNDKKTSTTANISSTTKMTSFGVKFTPNLFINFKNSFGLNFNIGSLGYETSKVKDSDLKTNSFGFGFGKGVTVGISKNFGLK